MEISFRFEGFEEVQRGVEALSSSAEIGAINKKNISEIRRYYRTEDEGTHGKIC